MWIRRWRKAGRISATEAKTFEKHLEKTGTLLKPATPRTARTVRKISDSHTQRYSKPVIAPVFPTGPVVTVQYDPSKFRIEFTAIRRERRAKVKSAQG